MARKASEYMTGQTFLINGGWKASRIFHYRDEKGVLR